MRNVAPSCKARSGLETLDPGDQPRARRRPGGGHLQTPPPAPTEAGPTGDTGTSKGKPIRTLMEKYNSTACAYIGDTQGDYEATVEAGVPFLWASYGFGIPAGYAGKIDSFEELLKL